MTTTRAMKPTVDVVQPLVAAVYEHRGEFCCCWQVLENGRDESWWIDEMRQQARELEHTDCEEVLGLMRLMSGTQRTKVRPPRMA